MLNAVIYKASLYRKVIAVLHDLTYFQLGDQLEMDAAFLLWIR